MAVFNDCLALSTQMCFFFVDQTEKYVLDLFFDHWYVITVVLALMWILFIYNKNITNSIAVSDRFFAHEFRLILFRLSAILTSWNFVFYLNNKHFFSQDPRFFFCFFLCVIVYCMYQIFDNKYHYYNGIH